MAQIQKGYEYDSTIPSKNVVTDANLNSLVSNATLLNGAIAEQFPNSSTADSDLMLLSKGGSLIKQTKGQFTDIINSNTINVNTVNASIIDADDVDTVDATLTGNLSVGGNSSMTGNLSIAGNISGNLTVTGLVTASTAPTVGGHLVNKTYVDGAVSKNSNGYVTLPNGLIFQWGTTGAVAPDNSISVTFPIPFPTACFNVQASVKTGTGAGIDVWAIGVTFSSTITIIGLGANGGTTGAVPLCWFAIGH